MQLLKATLKACLLFLGAASASGLLRHPGLSGWTRAAAALVLAEIVFYAYQCWRRVLAHSSVCIHACLANHRLCLSTVSSFLASVCVSQ